MSHRTDLIATIRSSLATHTAFKVSDELPFNSADVPLYNKNIKTVYVSEEEQSVTEFIPTLSGDIMQTESVITAFLTTDAKTQPSDIETVVSKILASRSAITGAYQNESTVEYAIEDDYITYTFNFNFAII